MPSSIRAFQLPVTLSLAMCLGACGGGPVQTVTRSVELDHADAVAVSLEIGAGELHIDGGSGKLLEGTFAFNVPEWEPKVDYRRDGARGVLSVKQPAFTPRFGNQKNTWDLRISDRVPISLSAHVGAGESTLRLGTLDLQSVQVDVGAGEVTIDLRGTPMRSYDATINASVGQTTIRLPRTVGIVATAAAGVGGVNISGLKQEGSSWVNAGHEQDRVVIRLNVKGGVGQIDLSAE